MLRELLKLICFQFFSASVPSTKKQPRIEFRLDRKVANGAEFGSAVSSQYLYHISWAEKNNKNHQYHQQIKH